ncbi:MAG TPA: GWxTD domain-containing protein, partial [Bacteroidetes bacterium]|nr:GWxTD domain-containing protein [Bacteroidota bacterium]
VTANSYRQTNSGKFFLEFRTRFDLPPTDYSIVCEVTDLDSKKSVKAKQKIKLRDYSKPVLAVSDVRLIDPTDLSQKELGRLKEIFAKQLSKFSGYLVATYEVYSPHSTPLLKQEIKLSNFRNRVVQKSKFKMENKGFGTVVYVPIFKQNLSVGLHVLKIKIDDGIDKINVERKIRANNINLPISIENLDLAIEQMRYIADKSAIKHIKKAPPGKKKLYFDAYWKKNDPTPGTDANELMDEYYRRVAFSNAHFSGFRDGWKTDMGMIFILFGSPDDVEREPYNATINPYASTEIYAWELWNYYNFNRRFVFVDERGFGEYRLLNPNDIYINR